MKGSHQFAELKVLYAAETGRAKRTAQLHAKENHPDWVAFVARTAGKGLKAAAPTAAQGLAVAERLGVQIQQPLSDPLVVPEAARKPVHLRTVEEHVECEAWDAYCLAASEMKRMMVDNPAMAVAFVKIATDAQKAFHSAKQRRVQADIERGRLKPSSAWHSVKAVLSMVAGMIERLEEIAAAANPDNPAVARRAIVTWKHERFVPQIQELIRDAEGVAAV